MIKETLAKRLEELEIQKRQAQIRLQQAHDDIICIDGAMQEVGYWVKQGSPNVQKEEENKSIE